MNNKDFRKKNRSTLLALVRFTDKMLEAINNRKFVFEIILDFSKAFNKIHHNFLGDKITNINFSNTNIRLIKNYQLTIYIK